MNRTTKNTLIPTVFYIIAALYLILAIISTFSLLSPIPVVDMWKGLDNFIRSKDDPGLWWSAHNEHRIIFARLFFWIDFTLFNGSNTFLVVINFILAGCNFIIFYKYLKDILHPNHQLIRNCVGAIIFGLLFSSIQYENFIYGFQIQFFAAQTFPLLAFYLIHKSADSDQYKNRYFTFSCIAGVLALGTMANGILCFPLMLLSGLLMKMRKQYLIFLLIFSIIAPFIYFYDHGHTDGLRAINHSILSISLIKQFLFYLGGPFSFIPYYYTIGLHFPLFREYMICFMGLFLVINQLFFTWQIFRKVQSSIQIALIIFIFYVFISGLGIVSAGRIINDSGEMFQVSRYQTPILMAWISLLILYSPLISNLANVRPYLTFSLLFACALILLPRQFAFALKGKEHSSILFERKIAALSLNMKIRDLDQIDLIYPSKKADHLFEIVNRAIDKNISIFNDPDFKDARKSFQEQDSIQLETKGEGGINSIIPIDSHPLYVKIDGWISQRFTKDYQKGVRILDANFKVIGYALVDNGQQDNIDAQADFARYKFKGYMLADQPSSVIILRRTTSEGTIQTMIQL